MLREPSPPLRARRIPRTKAAPLLQETKSFLINFFDRQPFFPFPIINSLLQSAFFSRETPSDREDLPSLSLQLGTSLSRRESTQSSSSPLRISPFFLKGLHTSQYFLLLERMALLAHWIELILLPCKILSRESPPSESFSQCGSLLLEI